MITTQETFYLVDMTHSKLWFEIEQSKAYKV